MEHDARTEVAHGPCHGRARGSSARGEAQRGGSGHGHREAVAHLPLESLVDKTRISTLQVRGVSANVFELRPEAHIIAGRAIQPGTDEALVGKAVFGRYPGLRIGEQVEFSYSTRPTVVCDQWIHS
jgi:putative ABC transport system permease protein